MIDQPDASTGVIIFQHGGTYELDGDTMQQADSEGVFNETWKRVK